MENTTPIRIISKELNRLNDLNLKNNLIACHLLERFSKFLMIDDDCKSIVEDLKGSCGFDNITSVVDDVDDTVSVMNGLLTIINNPRKITK